MAKEIEVPDPSDDRVLRHVRFDRHRLLTWDTGKRARTGQHQIGYAFYLPDAKEPLFKGEDIGVSPVHCIDSDEALRSVIGWLTLQEGDVEAEFFKAYTVEQIEFTRTAACEELISWAREDRDEDEETYEFEDIE